MRRAFTLIELSIVLIILGLLVGGVLSGQSLIRAAELRSISTEYDKYRAAMNSFRDKYFALPGDMNNAVRFWGAYTGATTDGMDTSCMNATVPAGGSTTCNGDGNGLIGTGRLADSPVGSREARHFWRQLNNAGMIEGDSAQVPRPARINPGFWRINGFGQTGGEIGDDGLELYTADYRNSFSLGAFTDEGSRMEGGFGPLLMPEEAWNLDTKMDDGAPGTGIVLSNAYDGDNEYFCVTNDNKLYALTLHETECIVFLKSGL